MNFAQGNEFRERSAIVSRVLPFSGNPDEEASSATTGASLSFTCILWASLQGKFLMLSHRMLSALHHRKRGKGRTGLNRNPRNHCMLFFS